MDYAEALNNADAPSVLRERGQQEGGWLCSKPRWRGRRKGLARAEGIAGRAGDFARRSYSETFEHLFHESAYYVRRRGCRSKEATPEGCSETSVLDLVSTCTGREGALCVCRRPERGCETTTADFVTPATSDVLAIPYAARADLRLDDNLTLTSFFPIDRFPRPVSLRLVSLIQAGKISDTAFPYAAES